ncbi:unnamed protein product, partial [Dibothriocephalus latus]
WRAFELARSKLSRILKSRNALNSPSTGKSVSCGNGAQSGIGSFLEYEKYAQLLGKSLEDLSRTVKSGMALNFPPSPKSIDDASAAIRSFLKNSKNVHFLEKSLEDLKKTSSSKLEECIRRCSLAYDSITGREIVRKASLSVLEAEQAFVDCQLSRRRCQQKLFELQKRRVEAVRQADLISPTSDSFNSLITIEREQIQRKDTIQRVSADPSVEYTVDLVEIDDQTVVSVHLCCVVDARSDQDTE